MMTTQFISERQEGKKRPGVRKSTEDGEVGVAKRTGERRESRVLIAGC